MSVRVRLPELHDWKAQVKCQLGCPVLTDAGRYVQLIAEGRDEDAYLVARSPNPLASICGRVCAAPCEDACRRGNIDLPISIRALKRTVCERYGAESRRPDTQDRLRTEPILEGNRYPGHLPVTRLDGTDRARGKQVAVIGSGPAGLAAAHDLALLGYAVTLFEASAAPGGMLRYGIPEYRLPRTLIDAEVAKIQSLGVTLKLETPLTPSFGLGQLRDQGFEAIFLATGVQKGRDLQLPGVELDGVIKAIDYLLNVNRGYRVQLGKKVLVIGGGFVAFDAARTALRLRHPEDADKLASSLEGEAERGMKDALDSARAALRSGAPEVTIASLESLEEMPALRSTQGKDEFEEATHEGVKFLTRRGPLRFVGDRRLRAVELRKVLSVFDEHGRFAPRYDDADVQTVEADSCILAIGQRADLSFVKPEDKLELNPGGGIKIDPVTLATSAPGIYAGGDVAFGPRNLIEAVGNGKRAARSIHGFLSGAAAEARALLEIEKYPTRRYQMVEGYEVLDRVAPPTLPLERRTGIAEVEETYPWDEARRQGARCLICHIQTIYDPEKCVLCGRCVDICPEHVLALVPPDAIELPDDVRARLLAEVAPGDLPVSVMLKDDARCIRCGLCAIRCPTDAMTMERFFITERFAGAATPLSQEAPR